MQDFDRQVERTLYLKALQANFGLINIEADSHETLKTLRHPKADHPHDQTVLILEDLRIILFADNFDNGEDQLLETLTRTYMPDWNFTYYTAETAYQNLASVIETAEYLHSALAEADPSVFVNNSPNRTYGQLAEKGRLVWYEA